MLVFLVRKHACEKQWAAALDSALVASIFGRASCLCLLDADKLIPDSLKKKFDQLEELACQIDVGPDKKHLKALISRADQVLTY